MKYKGKSKQQRQKEMDNILEKLETGVKEVFLSERYEEYLTFFSKFHNYSFNNVMLILSQCPYAKRVASFKTWNELGLKVKKGSKGIKVLVPIPYKFKKEEVVKDIKGNIVLDSDGSPKTDISIKQGINFTIGNVFDISQVEGEVPTLSKELKGNSEKLDEAIQQLIKSSSVPIEYDSKLNKNTANGYYSLDTKSIALRSDMSSMQTFKTLIHEKAHSILHDKENNQYTREEAEVQAESISFVVASSLGFDTSDYSFGYVASWSSNKELKELKKSLNVIASTSNEILKWIELYTDLKEVNISLSEIS